PVDGEVAGGGPTRVRPSRRDLLARDDGTPRRRGGPHGGRRASLGAGVARVRRRPVRGRGGAAERAGRLAHDRRAGPQAGRQPEPRLATPAEQGEPPGGDSPRGPGRPAAVRRRGTGQRGGPAGRAEYGRPN